MYNSTPFHLNGDRKEAFNFILKSAKIQRYDTNLSVLNPIEMCAQNFIVLRRSSGDLRAFLINLAVSDVTMAVFSIPFTYTM